MPNQTEVSEHQFVTFKQLASEGIFSEAGLRWLRFNESTNGLAEAGAFIKVGPRRVLIDRPRFFNWVRSWQQKDA